MSAVASPPRARVQAPAQLGLPDMPDMPEPMPALEPAPMQLAIDGQVAKAELRFSTDGRPHLMVALAQPHAGLPLIALCHGPADQRRAFEALASRLKPGTHVMLRGHGLAVMLRSGADHLQLVHCESVSELSFSSTTGGNPS